MGLTFHLHHGRLCARRRDGYLRAQSTTMLLVLEPHVAVSTPSSTRIVSENFAPVTPTQIADTNASSALQLVGQPFDEQDCEVTARIRLTGAAGVAAMAVSNTWMVSLRPDPTSNNITANTDDNKSIAEDRILTSIPCAYRPWPAAGANLSVKARLIQIVKS
jgi:hypothetical protein